MEVLSVKLIFCGRVEHFCQLPLAQKEPINNRTRARAVRTPVWSFILEEERDSSTLQTWQCSSSLHEILCQEGLASPAGMYTTGLNPFYASNFSLWTAYCSGGFGVDSMKKPSFCIADILHVGDAENIPGSSSLMAHIGARASGSPLRPSPVTPDARAYHRHGIHLTSVSRSAMHAHSAPPPSSKDLKFGIDRILSTDFEPKAKDAPSLRGKSVFMNPFFFFFFLVYHITPHL